MGGVSCSKIGSRHCEAVASSAMAAAPQLLSESAIRTRVHVLATRSDEDYANVDTLVLIGVLDAVLAVAGDDVVADHDPNQRYERSGLGILDHAGRLSCRVPHGQCGRGKV